MLSWCWVLVEIRRKFFKILSLKIVVEAAAIGFMRAYNLNFAQDTPEELPRICNVVSIEFWIRAKSKFEVFSRDISKTQLHAFGALSGCPPAGRLKVVCSTSLALNISLGAIGETDAILCSRRELSWFTESGGGSVIKSLASKAEGSRLSILKNDNTETQRAPVCTALGTQARGGYEALDEKETRIIRNPLYLYSVSFSR
ncbi:hypothetical protein EVAR_36839_1 [Eumeta japonica]|uniref:Uncharacterized protein n=1 Tax=Eumeta variegata TaxID=151549 RepID=A0A4C1WE52_EUMVA|nr:hypothetical protein EVAR_36839_1 [Eumeta japonica]